MQSLDPIGRSQHVLDCDGCQHNVGGVAHHHIQIDAGPWRCERKELCLQVVGATGNDIKLIGAGRVLN